MNRLPILAFGVAAALVLSAQAPPAPQRVSLPADDPVSGADIAASAKACEGGPNILPQYRLSQCNELILARQGVSPAQKSRALFNRSQAYFTLGHLDKSEADLDAVLKADPKQTAAWRDRAKVRFYLKKYDDAIADATEALSLKPNDPEAFYHRANALYEKREYSKALADYDAAIKADPGYAHAYADRGITQLRRENFTAAIADIEKAIALEGKPIPWAQAQLEEAKAALEGLAMRRTRSLTPATTQPAPRDQPVATAPRPVPAMTPAAAPVLKTRVALVIGNSNYAFVSKLPNAANDATDVAKAFQAAGYTVFGYPALNLNRQQMFEAIKAFQTAAASADAAVVWYAGHGQEFDLGGTKLSNWLIPVDFPVDGDILEHGIPLSRLMTAVSPAGTLRVVIVDACRNSNLPSGSRGSRGFSVEERSDMLIVYSTRAGRVAEDGPKGTRNSPFAEAFLETMKAYGKVDVRQFFGGVSQGTVARTRNLSPPQEPEMIVRIQTIATLPLAP